MARRQADDGVGGLCPHHREAQIFQCGSEGVTTTYGPSYGPGGAPRERITSEMKMPMGNDMLANKATYGVTKVRGGGGGSFTTLKGDVYRNPWPTEAQSSWISQET